MNMDMDNGHERSDDGGDGTLLLLWTLVALALLILAVVASVWLMKTSSRAAPRAAPELRNTCSRDTPPQRSTGSITCSSSPTCRTGESPRLAVGRAGVNHERGETLPVARGPGRRATG